MQLIENGKSELFYFSFVSLTTLGFGDISPVSDAAQILSTLEAIFGVVLLTALIGRLVALLVAQERTEAQDSP